MRIAVKAAAVNFFDLLILIGQYQIKPPLPYTIGSEGSGIIIETGPGVVQFRVGEEVMVGMVAGCMAEELVVQSKILLRKPPSFTFPQAAGFFVGYSTAYHGLVQRGQMKKGETVFVSGSAGGMGLAALQLSALLGAGKVAY